MLARIVLAGLGVRKKVCEKIDELVEKGSSDKEYAEHVKCIVNDINEIKDKCISRTLFFFHCGCRERYEKVEDEVKALRKKVSEMEGQKAT